MKSRFVAAVVVLCSFGGAAFGDPNTEIWYAASYPGSGLELGERWIRQQ